MASKNYVYSGGLVFILDCKNCSFYFTLAVNAKLQIIRLTWFRLSDSIAYF